MKIAVIGTGYVGLVAGACFSDTGNDVYCVDKDAAKIENLKRGVIPIYEPGLETLVHRNAGLGRLKFTTSIQEAVQAAEVIFMAVGTPPLPNGEPDLRFLEQAAYEVGAAMNGYKLVVNKSTVPIGSHMTVGGWISSKTHHPVDVVSNPEFLKEGSALDDFLKPDRVVIGTAKKEVYEKMVELYSPFVRQGNPILWMDPVSAEMTKYACNSFLATRISFMNELAQLCEKVGGDIELVRKGMTSAFGEGPPGRRPHGNHRGR
jgi:UDPglucose 6-dehydrogenase